MRLPLLTFDNSGHEIKREWIEMPDPEVDRLQLLEERLARELYILWKKGYLTAEDFEEILSGLHASEEHID